MAFRKAREEYKWKQWNGSLKVRQSVTVQEFVKEVEDTELCGYLAGLAPLDHADHPAEDFWLLGKRYRRDSMPALPAR